MKSILVVRLCCSILARFYSLKSRRSQIETIYRNPDYIFCRIECLAERPHKRAGAEAAYHHPQSGQRRRRNARQNHGQGNHRGAVHGDRWGLWQVSCDQGTV